MGKPYTFANHVIKKYGRRATNDCPQPEKFFLDMKDLYNVLDAVPFLAVEELEKYESNRDIMINIVRRIFKICDSAKIDIEKEIDRLECDPTDEMSDEDNRKYKIPLDTDN